MTHTAYRWRGDVFCEGDLVATMLDDEPWAMWAAHGHDSTDDVEADLDELAAMFGIDRTLPPENLAALDFPYRLDTFPDPPEFCSGCLNHFT